ncbi:MAG: T9SS type A sorting domain-containing protein [Bacteroidota bacterium]
MKRIYLILFAILLGYPNIHGQLVFESGNLFVEISDIISDMPGNTGDDYDEPSQLQLATWGIGLSELFSTNYSQAAMQFNSIGYSLVEYTDNTGSDDRIYYLIRSNGNNFWGTYVWYPNFERSLIIQSPHPQKDLNTGIEGIHVFRETGALFFCLSGTSRCNSSFSSNCSGNTSVCTGNSENYRISDLSHVVASVFQSTTDSLFNRFDESHFIQLHGFAKQPTDPYVILSNGTRETPIPDYLSAFRDNLFNEDNSLTFKIAHIDQDWTRLIGFTNTQGRLINASIDHCTENAELTNGRFFHVEQEKTKLRDNILGWNKVANALINTFPPVSTSVYEEIATPISVYPNPTTGKLVVEGKHNGICVFSWMGHDITAQLTIIKMDDKVNLDMSSCPAGIYFLKTEAGIIRFVKH